MGFIDKALEKAKVLKQKAQEKQDSPAPEVPTFPTLDTPLTEVGTDTPTSKIRNFFTRTVLERPETLQQQKIIWANENNEVQEEYKILRTQILQRTKADQKNTLMVTGPLPEEGKTLTAINLAISIAKEVDKSVLLVDLDLRSPSVHRYFGLSRSPGLVDYLSGSMSLPEIVVYPEGFDKLAILPAGRAVLGAAELIGSPMMAELVKELKQFSPDRYVLFDLPPVLPYADPLAFAPFVDGIILVVEVGKTPKEEIQKCVELLKDFPILGLVLNKVDRKDENYYYYYHRKNNERKVKKKGLLDWVKF